jgi:ribonuclease HI
VTKDQQSQIKDWQRMWFKKNKVWMAIDSQGTPISKDSKVLIKYQKKQEYEYWVNKKNVRPLDSPPPKSLHPNKRKNQKKKVRKDNKAAGGTPWDEAEYRDKICLFTDGASSGNPGPSGIGVLLRYGEHQKEISKYIGNATNNIAELQAIKAGLSALKHTDIPVRLFTDSSYAYGLLVLNWKPRKNQELVGAIKKIMARFKDLQIIKVKGHAGHRGNERADDLATAAVKRQNL